MTSSDQYYNYIQDKRIVRHIILLFPFIGNLTILLWDIGTEHAEKREFLDKIRQMKSPDKGSTFARDFGIHLQRSYSRLKNDKAFVLKAINANPFFLKYASETI